MRFQMIQVIDLQRKHNYCNNESARAAVEVLLVVKRPPEPLLKGITFRRAYNKSFYEIERIR